MNGLIIYLGNDREHVAVCHGIPRSIQPHEGYMYHLAQYMYPAGCRFDSVDQFTKFIGIVATMDWRAIHPHNRDHVAT